MRTPATPPGTLTLPRDRATGRGALRRHLTSVDLAAGPQALHERSVVRMRGAAMPIFRIVGINPRIVVGCPSGRPTTAAPARAQRR